MQIAPIRDATARALPAQPRARGTGRVRAGLRGKLTVLRDLEQSGSTKLLFPRSHEGMTAVILNSAGGVTGGDRFDISAQVDTGATLRLTTQAAERAYRAQPGEVGRVQTRLDIGAGARLFWLPQETILFDGSALSRRLSVTMAPDAEALIVEPLVLGRAAMGEDLAQLTFVERIDIHRDGALLYADRTRLSADLVRADHSATLAGHRAAATVILASPRADAMLPILRARLPAAGPARGGASLIRPDLISCRILARSGYELRKLLIPLLETLTETDLPRPWML